jgi:chromosome segregation protein
LYLKKINLYAFKTFADKTELEFDPGITAIVGPNGCGKSNISDAVAWVMGEQNPRQLRGSRMEDVIFAGSAGRRPLNLAEVTLILDNSDSQLPLEYDEVSITRRLYRSGDSEYLLNKTPCRLKDISDLLLDTGLGKEAYAFITQGEVDAILSNKPEDRRSIFEEAAGIQKYKYRKREALRKLDTTQTNLIRLNDIALEIERQIGPLEEDAAKAEEYKAAAQRLQSAQLDLFIHRIAKFIARLEKIAEQTGTITIELRMHEGRMETLETELATARIKQTSEDDKADGLRIALQQATSESDRFDSEYRLNEEKISNLKRHLADLETRSAEADEWCRQARQESASSQEELAELKKRIVEAAAEEEAAVTRRKAIAEQVESYRSRIEDMRRNNLGTVADMAGRRSLLEEREKQHQSLSESLQRSEQERQNHQASHEQQQAEIAALEIKQSALIAQRDDSADELKSLMQQAAGLEAKSVAQAEEASQMQRQAASLQSRYDLLREMEKNLEGYYQGVKSVIGWMRAGQTTQVIGTVADIINVSGKYEVAIETALGSAIQNIITRDDLTAKEMIARLKRHKGGRATFMPLNMIKAPDRTKFRRYADKPGVVGRAADLVECAPEYKEALELLLGHIIVMPDLDSAVELARSDRDIRIVTLEGESISPGGAITGGSSARRQNFLARERELAEAAAALKGLDEAEKELSDQRRTISAAAVALQEDIKNSENTLAEMNKRLAALREELNQAAWRKDALENEMRKASLAVESYKNELANVSEEIVLIGDELRQIQDGSIDADAALQSYLAREDELASKERELQEVVTARRMEIGSLNHREQTLLGRLEELEKGLAENSKFTTEAAGHIAVARADLQRLLAAVEVLKKSRGDASARRDMLQTDLEACRAARQRLQAECASLEDGVRTARQAISDLQSKEHRLQLQAARLEADRDALCQRLREEYRIGYNEGREIAHMVESETALAEEVGELRSVIENAGAVNLKARQELTDLKERYELLTTQRDDLVKAREALLEAIDEIDRVSLSKFSSTFAEISRAFQRLFVRLFGGGEADIYLKDESDPLNSGIEIVAKPPGKKMQNLTLLSGGERTLTVLALFFAVLEVKPSPFCVLDEVEAALDESNVERFGEVLREFAGRTQFLIITHNKGTMETARTLYGVTMSEPGVSRIVSVKMVDEVNNL